MLNNKILLIVMVNKYNNKIMDNKLNLILIMGSKLNKILIMVSKLNKI